MFGHFLRSIWSSCSHNSSIGLRSGDCAGHSITDRIPAYSSSCIVWRHALGHCPVVGGNWLQSSAVHRVWHGVAKWSDSLPYSKSLLPPTPNLPAPKQPQTITLPPPCLTDGVRYSSSIFSLVLHLINVLLCDPNTSNLDLSVHNTFPNLPLSNVCVLLPILIFSFYWSVSNMTFSLPLCLEGQHLHCGRWDWRFAGVYFSN